MTLTWWLLGKTLGMLRFPLIGLVTLHRPELVIRHLERSRGSRAFRFSVPGLIFLIVADRKDGGSDD